MNMTGLKIGSKYMVGPKIGSGSFGQVYVVNQVGTYQIFALKKEDQKNKHSQLPLQSKILKQMSGCTGFSQIHWQGSEGKSSLVIMDMLGPSLEDLFQICDKKFSLKTTSMLADQIIERIQQLHKKNFIHRDIKPQNFLMGINNNSHIVHLIDFGLSKKYRDQKTLQHIPYKQNKSLTGTARYASINAHLGIQQSRRDDLQAVGYMLLYFIQGYLPWQGIKANNKAEKYQKIMEKKMSIPIQIQCEGLPMEFATYLNYCRSLKFEDQPDYCFLRKIFRDLIQRENQVYDYCYDWCSLSQSRHYNNGKINIDLNSPQNEEKVDNDIDHIIEKQLNDTPNQQKAAQIAQSDDQMIDGQQNIDEEQGVDQLMSQDQFEVKDTKDALDMVDKKNTRLLI